MKTKTPEEAMALLDAGIAGAEYLHAEIRRLEAENQRLREQVETLMEHAIDAAAQACTDPQGRLNSYALSSNADLLRFLAEHGKVRIVSEYGRCVIAEWVPVREGE